LLWPLQCWNKDMRITWGIRVTSKNLFQIVYILFSPAAENRPLQLLFTSEFCSHFWRISCSSAFSGRKTSK
jgi:hypothetical protein